MSDSRSTGRRYAIWHDRAVFHFLTDADDRERDLATLRKFLRSRGHLVLGSFGPEAPTRCGGLPVQRYSIPGIVGLVGPGLALRMHHLDGHRTPAGTAQQLLYEWRQAET